MASGEEIQAALREFVSKWADYSGTEKSEAQTFLNELLACFGSDRRALGAKFEDFRTSAGFMDLHWPGICIVAMKAPSRELSVALQQVRRYRGESSDMEAGVEAARYCRDLQLPAVRDLAAWLVPGQAGRKLRARQPARPV